MHHFSNRVLSKMPHGINEIIAHNKIFKYNS